MDGAGSQGCHPKEDDPGNERSSSLGKTFLSLPDADMIRDAVHLQWGLSQSQPRRDQIHQETQSKYVTAQMPLDNYFKI